MSLLLSAFSGRSGSTETPVFYDDFESYLNSAQLQTSYTVWEEGALLDLALEHGYTHSGDQSLRIDVLGANPQTLSTSASIYHLLQLGESNWSDSAALRLWIRNLSSSPLSFTINFKEKYSEFWSVMDGGLYYRVDPAGVITQDRAQYGNLTIPAFYQGFLLVPFQSFHVPGWNTAKGNEKMEMSAIDSFSFGINITVNELQRFYVDDVEVVPQSQFTPGELIGADTILIPQSGEHREPYHIGLPESMKNQADTNSIVWSLDSSDPSMLAIDQDGWLSVSAGASPQTLMVQAALDGGQHSQQLQKQLTLVDPNAVVPAQDSQPAVQAEIADMQQKNAAYQQFANQFEQWASDYRAVFVLISVADIILILVGLAVLQNRLK